MSFAVEVLTEWSSDTRDYFEAKVLWSQAIQALGKLPKDVPAATLQVAFDRFLAEGPLQLYRILEKIPDFAWPTLLEALERCSDIEARLLLSAHKKKVLAEMKSLVALVSPTSNCPNAAQKIRKLGEVDDKVVALCLDSIGDAYPCFSVMLAGAYATVILYGSDAQVKKLLALKVTGEEAGWILGVSRSISDKTRKKQVQVTIQSIDPTYNGREPDKHRFKRVFKPGQNPAPTDARKPTVSGADEKSLLAAIYAAPGDDGPRAVYADYLLEKGEALGELIQLQLARAAGKKGTLSKEKLIFERHGAKKLWPDHPVVLLGDTIEFDDLSRGFPSVTRLGALESYGGAELKKTIKALTQHPGWSTLTKVRDADKSRLAEFFPAQMPLLKDVRNLSIPGLDKIGAFAWPITRLELHAPTNNQKVTKRAEALCRTVEEIGWAGQGWPNVAIEKSGLLDHAKKLGWWGGLVEINDALEVHAALPKNIEIFETLNSELSTRLVRQKGGVEARFEASKFQLENVLTFLEKMEKNRFSHLELVLSSTGFYTKRDRPTYEAQAKKVLKRFKNSKLTSIHPK